MNIQEYNNKIKALIDAAGSRIVERVFVPAANELLATTKNRIINEGLNEKGGKIGTYSTKPSYYTKDQFVKGGAFKPIGKNGGKTKSTMYLKDGYKQLREIQGREGGFVNLEYSGDMMLSYQSVANETSIVQGLNKESEAKKYRGLKKSGKFGENPLGATKSDIEIYNKNVRDEVEVVTKEIFK